MVVIATRVRSAALLVAAGTAVFAGLCQSSRAPGPPRPETSEILAAALTSAQVIAGDQDLAVTIRAPGVAGQPRPPVSLVVVLDRSGSMHGEPLANAKRAAIALVDQLSDADAFALVTFSDREERVLAVDRATAAHKRDAAGAISRIVDDGGTCTSCGLAAGAAELARSPVQGGVARMVLISDGQANEGVWDRDELVAIAAATAAHGVTISTVGVGLDFDEQTLIRIGEVGRGHYDFVEDTASLGAMLARELADLRATVATDVHLVIEPRAAEIAWAYGYPATRTATRIDIPIADLRAGERAKVVLHGRVAGPDIARFELTWRTPFDRALHRTATSLTTRLTRDPAVEAATRNEEASAAVDEARIARALDDAATVYERAGAEPAKRLIQRELARARERVPGPRRDRIERVGNEVIESFDHAPGALVMKAMRTGAYLLAR